MKYFYLHFSSCCTDCSKCEEWSPQACLTTPNSTSTGHIGSVLQTWDMVFICSMFNEESPKEADGTLAVMNQSWLQYFFVREYGIEPWRPHPFTPYIVRGSEGVYCARRACSLASWEQIPVISLDRFSLPPAKHHILMWGEQKITVSSDPFVRSASIKVAEWGFHIELYFIVTLSRSDSSEQPHSSVLPVLTDCGPGGCTCIFSYTLTCTDEKVEFRFLSGSGNPVDDLD